MPEQELQWRDPGSARILGFFFAFLAVVVAGIRVLGGEGCVGACAFASVLLLMAFGAGALALIVAAAFFLA